MNKNSTLWIVILVLTAAFSRLIPHPPNFTPVLAMALFAGAKLQHRSLSVVLPLLAMFLSDLFIGLHSTMPYVYLGTAVAAFLGWTMKSKTTLPKAVGQSLIASTVFFIVSNFGVWIVGGLYPQNLMGLQQCFVLAIPFFHNTVLSTLLYGAILFVAYEWLTQRKPSAFRASKENSR